MQESLRLEINKNSISALSRNLHSRHLAYLDIARLEVATAVPVKIGSRLLLATSAHTLRDRFSDGLPIVGNQLTEVGDSRARVLNLVRREWPDVGLIELEPGSLERVGKHAIELDRIRNVGVASQERLAFVYGYPSRKVRPLRSSPGRVDLDFKPVSYCHVPLSVQDWPEMRSPDDPVPNIETDIFLRYDLDESVVRFAENEGEDKPVAPHGMSGGGWWQGPDKSNEVWSPEDAKLIGLQVSWHSEGKYIRGCQIHHWLKLVYDSYPDLRDQLVASFQSLRLTRA